MNTTTTRTTPLPCFVCERMVCSPHSRDAYQVNRSLAVKPWTRAAVHDAGD
jgi:hypothetical protein